MSIPSPTADAAAPDSHINHEDAKKYWTSIDADVNGMLGGYPQVSRVDLQGSKNFLAKLGIGVRKAATRRSLQTVSSELDDGKVGRAVDCGAGIGRITKGLLLKVAREVDIVEPVAKFTTGLIDDKDLRGLKRIFNVGLEAWTPAPDHYDLIWNQWCVGHLNDSQLADYLRKCGEAVKTGGYVVVKENLSLSDSDIFDEIDSSVTRTEAKFCLIFKQAGLVIKKSELQRGMPSDLCPVRIWALQAKTA